jgi:hypothetical protein
MSRPVKNSKPDNRAGQLFLRYLMPKDRTAFAAAQKLQKYFVDISL